MTLFSQTGRDPAPLSSSRFSERQAGPCPGHERQASIKATRWSPRQEAAKGLLLRRDLTGPGGPGLVGLVAVTADAAGLR